jgi:hypothetical protein
MNKWYNIHVIYSKLIEYSPNLVVRDLRCDHNLLKYLIILLPSGIIP